MKDSLLSSEVIKVVEVPPDLNLFSSLKSRTAWSSSDRVAKLIDCTLRLANYENRRIWVSHEYYFKRINPRTQICPQFKPKFKHKSIGGLWMQGSFKNAVRVSEIILIEYLRIFESKLWLRSFIHLCFHVKISYPIVGCVCFPS